MKISNLLDKDLKIVEKKKIFFLIPVIIVAVTAIMMLIYGLVLGSPLNLGTDFTGGYSLDVTLGTKLTTENRAEYENQIRNIIESVKDENGSSYNVKVKGIQQQGTAESAALHIMYKVDAEERIMDEEINPKLQKELASIFKIIPSVVISSSDIVIEYSVPLGVYDSKHEIEELVENELKNKNITVTSAERSSDGMKITVHTSGSITEDVAQSVKSAATIDDRYSGLVSLGSATSASFSAELLWSALAAILASVVLMLVYIAFRFELTSGLSAIIALFHDILIMFCFMAIFRIEINSTFIAALITILGYSINNTIVIFDRIRENKKSEMAKTSTAAFIANKSVGETLLRSVNTTLTTLLTIGMVAILGVRDIKIFALPIIIGLLAGTYSSIFISPSIWASWKDRKKKGLQSGTKEVKKATAAH